MTHSIVRHATITSLLVGAVALAGTAFGQAQKAAPSVTAATIPSMSESTAKAFEKLDTTHSGYVTKAQTAGLRGFDTPFERADVDHDGRLSEPEFGVAWSLYVGREA